ncbi:class I SAM-dependent methyltransferase [Nocardiopsis coralli]|nr:class I SAM-dependent methyltransferase [Nocardiopsis coralli]
MARWWNRRAIRDWYDPLVVHGTYKLLWRCHVRHVTGLYLNAICDNDTVLEIGPANGAHLDRADRQGLNLHLLDVFPGSLRAASERLERYAPVPHLADALEPFPLAEDSVDAVVMSMVLHCLPGRSIADKEPVFDHIADVLRPGGTFAGATVLAEGIPHTRRSRIGLNVLNKIGLFSCYQDSLTDLQHALARFDRVKISRVGSVALWQGVGR